MGAIRLQITHSLCKENNDIFYIELAYSNNENILPTNKQKHKNIVILHQYIKSYSRFWLNIVPQFGLC